MKYGEELQSSSDNYSKISSLMQAKDTHNLHNYAGQLLSNATTTAAAAATASTATVVGSSSNLNLPQSTWDLFDTVDKYGGLQERQSNRALNYQLGEGNSNPALNYQAYSTGYNNKGAGCEANDAVFNALAVYGERRDSVKGWEMSGGNARIGLNLGGRTYFSADDDAGFGIKRQKVLGPGPICQVDDCHTDLRTAKHYHRKHKVCNFHSKAPTVMISGQTQRFCQQCSRFHTLSEFDDGKRSCRKRLADHNKRRRKPLPVSSSFSTSIQIAVKNYENDHSKRKEMRLAN